MKKDFYIKSILLVFVFLILSRIPSFLSTGLTPLIMVQSIVEIIFIIWGVLVLKSNKN